MDEQLFAAIAAKNLHRVEELLAAGANPNASKNGKTAYQSVPYNCDEIKCALIEAGAEDPELKHSLVWVIRTGRINAVRTLIEKGADVNVPTGCGTPIHQAASDGRTEIVELLIAAGADVDAGNSIGTPLLRAIEREHTEVALKLIAAGANPSETGRFSDTPPIAMAATRGLSEVIRALIDAGADVNAIAPHITLNQLEYNRSVRAAWKEDNAAKLVETEVAVNTYPVILAARCGRAETLAVLLETGADPHCKDGEGLSAYDWAVRNEDAEILAVLRRFGITETRFDPDEKLILAAERGDTEVVRDCLNAGADPNARDDRSRTRDFTPLMLAAIAGHSEIVAALLTAGADPNVTDRGPNAQPVPDWLLEHTDMETLASMGERFGRTALMMVAEIGNAQIVRQLLEAGADPNFTDAVDYTALAFAAANDRLETVRVLVEAGADVNGAVTYGNTSLMLACEKGAVDVARFLLDRGADANTTNRDRETALMRAAEIGHPSLVRLLVDRGADPNVVSSLNHTAISLAAEASHFVPVKTNRGSYSELQPLPEDRLIEVVELLLKAGADPNHPECSTTPVIEAAAHCQLRLIKLLLDNGARLDIGNRYGNTAISRAKFYGQQKVLEFLREYTGTDLSEFDAIESEPEPDRDPEEEARRWGEDVPQPDFSEAAQNPNYQQAVDELAEICGSTPVDRYDIPGWFSLHVNTKRRQNIDTEQLQRQFLEKGCFVYEPGYSYSGTRPERLCILPTTDKYDAIALHQTNGCNYGIGPGYVIQWLKELEATQPFILTCIAHDTLAGRFLTPIQDPEGLAERMYDFCSDIIEQGCGSIERLAARLAESDDLFFWWD